MARRALALSSDHTATVAADAAACCITVFFSEELYSLIERAAERACMTPAYWVRGVCFVAADDATPTVGTLSPALSMATPPAPWDMPLHTKAHDASWAIPGCLSFVPVSFSLPRHIMSAIDEHAAALGLRTSVWIAARCNMEVREQMGMCIGAKKRHEIQQDQRFSLAV